MRQLAYTIIATVAFAAPAGAAKFEMQLQAAPEQVSRIESGVSAVESHSQLASVRFVQSEGSIKKRGSIRLLVMNHADRPFNFGSENVSAKLADGTPVAIIPHQQLVKEEKNRRPQMESRPGFRCVRRAARVGVTIF